MISTSNGEKLNVSPGEDGRIIISQSLGFHLSLTAKEARDLYKKLGREVDDK